MPRKQTKEEFIEKANKMHGDKFNYDLVNYNNSKTKVIIVCTKHGEFLQRPNDHLVGYGCKKCQYEKISKLNRFTNNEFIKKCELINDKIYDYSFVEYEGYEKKIKINCKKHGMFEQTPHAHLRGAGCPSCKKSQGEKRINNFLIKNKIKFKSQVSFKNLVGDKNSLFFDFYLPDYNMMIEFDGIQHYKPVKFFGGIKKFIKQKEYDNKKIRFVIDGGYKLLKLSYNTLKYLEDALECELKNNGVLC